ncbi:Flp pilus assembly protein, pilin Flp [uncultured Alphaproteobacteria bacterium]|uniref:Flp pilus assembly protein, pilin Flp n=1 Tax=uncultured Alphaproteobacteria bacterium TaxID=91750 RepID=A0A212KJI1_9PROT|nr:Flp pilus assembly protein, pilin Flp [uncultured Alphaproteobacteria bacterium]
MFTYVRAFLRLISRDEKGVTAIEYGLIAAIISLALVAGAQVAGPALNNMFTGIGNSLTAAQPAN